MIVVIETWVRFIHWRRVLVIVLRLVGEMLMSSCLFWPVQDRLDLVFWEIPFYDNIAEEFHD